MGGGGGVAGVGVWSGNQYVSTRPAFVDPITMRQRNRFFLSGAATKTMEMSPRYTSVSSASSPAALCLRDLLIQIYPVACGRAAPVQIHAATISHAGWF